MTEFADVIHKGMDYETLHNDERDDNIGHTYQVIKTAGPWKRYFAKLIDAVFMIVLWGIICGTLFPVVADLIAIIPIAYAPEIILGLIFVSFEGLITGVFGTTPGKWMFSLYVQSENGEKLPVIKSIVRSISSFAVGMAFGTTAFMYIALLYNYRYVKKIGRTFYDIKNNAVIVSKRFSVIRFVVVLVIVIVMVGAITLPIFNTRTEIPESSLMSRFYKAVTLRDGQELIDYLSIRQDVRRMTAAEFELKFLSEKVDELEEKVEAFPEDGDQSSYDALYKTYIEKATEFNQKLADYELKKESLNLRIDAFNKKYNKL